MADTPVRTGFVGCGGQASASWYPNFVTIPELDLVACCDIVPERAEWDAYRSMAVCVAILESIDKHEPVACD